jgi:hypothetical protein
MTIPLRNILATSTSNRERPTWRFELRTTHTKPDELSKKKLLPFVERGLLCHNNNASCSPL